MSNNRTYAIIPARAASKGVSRKNIRSLGGYPLIAYSIALAKMCKNIDRVLVSTDSREIAELSKMFGANVPFIRPPEFARDDSTDREFVLHALNWFQTNENVLPDFLVHLRPTTPLRNPELVEDAIRRLQSDGEATSLRSAHEASESPFKWFMLGEGGYFKGFGDYSNEPRQNVPKVFIPNGYVDILRTDHVRNSSDIHGDKIMSYISPSCCEVDTEEDLEYLEFELTRADSVVLNYLKSNFQPLK